MITPYENKMRFDDKLRTISTIGCFIAVALLLGGEAWRAFFVFAICIIIRPFR